MAITKIPAAGFTGNNFRNIIINGDMSIAQRGTSTASITGNGYHTIDRMFLNLTGAGTWTQSQDTDVPSGQGFAKSLKMDCTTANGSLSGGDICLLQQRIEGQNLQYLKKGTASAESLTVSFWVYATKTGTNICELYDFDNSRQISKSYTINTANTWEKKTLTFEGDTTGAFDNDNGNSLGLNFWLAAGSNFTSGTLSTTWTSVTSANRAVGQVNNADNTANNFYITGVQLEAGTTASDFEFLPVDVNLERCQRYFEKSYQLLEAPGTNTGAGKGFVFGASLYNVTTTGEVTAVYYSYKTRKRASPTIVLYDRAGNSGKGSRLQAGVAWTDNITATVNTANDENGLNCYTASGSTATGMGFHFTSNSEL